MDTEREKSFTRGPECESPGARLVSRKIPSQNVVSRLVCRELFGTNYRCPLLLGWELVTYFSNVPGEIV